MVKLVARGRRGRSRLDELEVVADPDHRPAVAVLDKRSIDTTVEQWRNGLNG
jgi:hypothetical protein